MPTFIDRLKKKDVIPSTPDDTKRERVAAQVVSQPTTQEVALTAEQLKVDIYKTPTGITIYAQIAGSSIENYDVLIEGDDDIVTIKGTRSRPSGEKYQRFAIEGQEKILEECSWGKFYRQIILPAEVDPTTTEAVMSDGVLMVYLPLRHAKASGVRIPVNKF